MRKRKLQRELPTSRNLNLPFRKELPVELRQVTSELTSPRWRRKRTSSRIPDGLTKKQIASENGKYLGTGGVEPSSDAHGEEDKVGGQSPGRPILAIGCDVKKR